jgi:phosphonate transport system substrate-binding protein
MEDATQTMPKRRTNPLLLILVAVVIAAVIGWAMYFVQVRQPIDANRAMNSENVKSVLGMKEAAPLHLAEKFKDADSDLVADPADAKDQIDPPTLLLSYVGSSEAESKRLSERFKEFVSYLQEKTGRKVDFVTFKNPDLELRALCEGKLHVAGINTGNVPTAVNQCGFIPICSLASDKDVARYQMQIIVPAGSSIQEVQGLKGHDLTLTEPGSNSGFKAPLVLLRDVNLEPVRDFNIRYSGSHAASIDGIASKKYQAAAVASDLLQRAMAEEPARIKKEDYRVIFESPRFPTAAFGYAWNLKPELAAKIKDAFLTFSWKGTGVEREFGASNQTKFAPIVFKDDFALVQRIDAAIGSVRTGDIESDASTQPDAMATTMSAAHSTTAPAVR